VTFDLDLDLEHTLDTGALGTIVCNFGRNPAICLRQEAIFVIGTKAPLSRDLWPWPWPWAWPGCAPTCWPSCASLVAIEPFLA